MEIAGRKIGPDQPPYFVAEIGSNHDGDLERATRLIYLAAKSGADAIKVQHFSARALVSPRDSSAETLALLATLSIPQEWTPLLAKAAKGAGVAFVSTPFDLERADEIEPYVDAFKIASGDVTWHELIRHVAEKDQPLLMATGASTEDEVDDAIGAYLSGGGDAKYGQDLVLMQCNANYSGELGGLRHANLNVLTYWRNNYYAELGLSDHTPGDVAVCAAIALGATVIEKHFTDDRTRPGPDHPFAMEPDDWRAMVERGRATWEALGDGVKKVEANEDPVPLRRALRWAHDLSRENRVPTGLARENFAVTRPRPEEALGAEDLDYVVGRFLKRDVEADTLVSVEDFE